MISYPTYAYYVTTCLNYADHRLYSVCIYYQAPLFADGFESGDTTAWPYP